MTVEAQQLCSRLESFGLEAGEARLYFHLSRLGPSRAADLAEHAGVHRTEVYRLAEALTRKGFADKTLERPVRFVPLPLERVLEKQAEEKEAALAALRSDGKRLVQEWPNQASAGGSGQQRFSVHQGMPHIQALFSRMLDGATEEVVLAMSRRGMAKLGVGDVVSRLARKVAEGVSVRVLTKIDAANVAELRQIAATCEVRHVELSGYHQMMLVDNREIALFVASGRQGTAGGEETVLWLNAQDFVLAQKALIDRTWKEGIRHQDMSVSLARHAPPPEISLVRGSWVIASKAKQMLSRGVGARILAPWDLWRRWQQQGVARLAEAHSGPGQIQVFVHGARLPGAIDPAMHVESGLPFGLLVTDQDEVLAVRADLAGGASGEEWAIHSTLPDVAQWAWRAIDAHSREIVHVPA